MLLGTSAACLAGPAILFNLRALSESKAIAALLQKINPAVFEQTFGVPVAAAEPLIKAKTVTISKLMELVPEGTIDPTPFLYDTTMQTIAGLAVLATFTHYCVKKVPEKYFEKEEKPKIVEVQDENWNK
jgi:hypothetical protein